MALRVALTDGIEIAPGAQQWEFHYTGLSLLVPQRSQFRYPARGLRLRMGRCRELAAPPTTPGSLRARTRFM